MRGLSLVEGPARCFVIALFKKLKMTVDNINWKCERRRDFLNAAYERNFIAKLDTLRKTRTLTYIGRRNVEN